jgi:hypothetical protein
MLRITTTIALLAILISPGSFWRRPECEAQNKIAPPEYDYYSFALTSISNSAAEASKLADVPQRVRLLISAVKILPASEHDQAVRLLEVALHSVKEWGSADQASWYQRNTAATLRNEVLAVYAVVDPEKATALQKEFQAAAESTTSNSRATSHKDGDWYTEVMDREAIADQAATIALSLIDTDPEKASGLVVQSLQGGTVSNVLLGIVQKLIQSGNRTFLNKLENGIGQMLATNVTLDPFSLTYASALFQADKDMPPAVKGAFVSFFMRSLQVWSGLVSDPNQNAGIDPFYIGTTFTMFSLTVRPIILQYSPEQLLMFDLVLDQVAPFVPAKTKSMLPSMTKPETFSNPRDRLADILREPNAQIRDSRLLGLAVECLRKKSPDDSHNELELAAAADAISDISDTSLKTVLSDALTITRVNLLVRDKDLIAANRLAESISTPETRAWAMLALSLLGDDPVMRFELTRAAMKALDAASPSPKKVELALMAAAMQFKDDPQRAFEMLSTAAKYANSSTSKTEQRSGDLGRAIRYGATIGKLSTILAAVPESLSEVEINPSLSPLGTTDWFRANQIVDDIHEPPLRLQLKLQFARAVLAQEPKPKRKEATRKPLLAQCLR